MSHEIKDTLKQARLNSGLSQTEVSERTDISRNSLRFYEAGRASPNHYKLTALCRLYNTTPNDLLGF